MAITAAQMAANQANAQHSTGPRTPEGKTNSAQNALRHGFRSRTVLLPGDDPAEYEALLAELTAHFTPEGLTEIRAVREMADAEWRLRRVRAYLEITLAQTVNRLQPEHPALDALELQTLAFHEAKDDLAPLLRYERKFERQYDRAYRVWHQARNMASLEELQEAEKMAQEIQDELRRQSGKRPAPNEPNATPRNAPCPCGSGEKYKRCCGHGAPPVLHPDHAHSA